jgi:hypothetical protein
MKTLHLQLQGGDLNLLPESDKCATILVKSCTNRRVGKKNNNDCKNIAQQTELD